MNIKSTLYTVVALLLLINADCKAQYDFLLNRSYAELAPVFDTAVFQKLKDLPQESFDREINKVKTLANKHHDDQLYMEARLQEWYYKGINKLHTSEQAKADMLKQLLAEATRKKLHKHTMLIKFELGGTYFYELHDYETAFTYFISNFADVVKMSSAEMPTKKAITTHTGNVYYNFGDYSTAKKYITVADTVENSWRPRVAIQCKNTLGLIYRHYGNYDSAISYFKQGIEIAKKAKQEVWVSILSGNIGIAYYKQGRYKEAIPLLKRDVDECLSFGAYDNGINSLIKLVSAHIVEGDMELAEQELKRGWQYADSMQDKMKHLPGLYTAQAKLCIAVGEYKKAHEYRDSANVYRDSLLNRDNIYQLSKVQNRLKQELHDKELESLIIEKELVSTTRNALIGAILLTGVIAYLIVNRQRNKNQLLKSEKSLAEAELVNATKELDSYTKSLQEKNAIIEKSVDEIERLQHEQKLKQVQEDNSEILQQLYSSTILTDEEWINFQKLFDKVHSGYILRLKEKYPDLTPADIRFVLLSKLKLNNKEMAGILGVRADSIRTYKHRLRKKFNIPEDSSLTEVIARI